MAKDIFDIIMEKEYHQLSSRELIELGEYCQNEQEFLAMKKVLIHSRNLSGGPKLAPREETKMKLDELFASTHTSRRPFRPFYLNPAIQVAAAAVIGFAVWMMFMINNENRGSVQLAENNKPKKTEETVTNKKQEDNSGKGEQVSEKTGKQEEQPVLHLEPALQNSHVLDDRIAERSRKSVKTTDDAISSESIAPVMEENAKLISFKSETSSADFEKAFEREEKDYKTVSTPASSAKDISTSWDLSTTARQKVSSVNLASQRNVMNYLTPRY